MAHYADYFRVVRHEVRVRLGLDAQKFMPGETVRLHLENAGTVQIVYGYDLRLEVWDGIAWNLSAASPAGWTQQAFGLPGGYLGRCELLPLPEDIGAGHYRVVKSFNLSLGERKDRYVKAIFDVVRE